MGRNVVAELRARVPGEVLDYTLLMGCLRDYANPRKRVTALLKAGDIVRVKKGLYVFGERHRKGWISREVLANLIYGPSYVSCESALSLHGLIPERLESVISMALKRAAEFSTPFGHFVYRHLNALKYAPGIEQRTVAEAHCLVASPEKALADLVAPLRDLTSAQHMRDYLYENLRIADDWLKSRARLNRVAKTYRNARVDLLLEVL